MTQPNATPDLLAAIGWTDIKKREQAVKELLQDREQQARISSLKRFSHVPPPHDEEWSEEFQKGVEHGVLLSQQKLRFEIQRLKKLQNKTNDGATND